MLEQGRNQQVCLGGGSIWWPKGPGCRDNRQCHPQPWPSTGSAWEGEELDVQSDFWGVGGSVWGRGAQPRSGVWAPLELRLKWDQDPARVGVSLSIRLT